MPARPLEKLLTVDDVARLLSVSKSTVRRLVGDGDLRPVRIGVQLRFDPADLAAYLARQRT